VAFDQIARHPWVDGNRMVIYGSSLGSTTAPLVAEGKKVAGIMVQGGGAFTYLERMINFDRLYFERSGKFRPEEIHRRMIQSIRFNQLYLLGRKTPEQIVRDNPDLAGVWESMRGTAEAPPHYGRPHAWHWQAADKDWLAAWAATDARVMVVYGEFDQFEERHGHRAIVEAVERLRPGTTRWLEIPGADHNLLIYPDRASAYAGKGGERRWELFVEPVAQWLREIARR